MRLSKIFAMAMMAAGALSVSAQGIEFMPEGSALQAAIDKAKQEGKMVFLDCYTSWCGPCKMMATKIFPTQEVGDFMNPKFVSIKIDMEKGEGPDIASRLQINAYPTFVIFNNDGSEAARFVGGGDAQGFIARVNENLGDNGPAAMEARFKAGDRDPQFLMDYLEYLGKVYRRQQCNTVAEILLEGKAETFASDTTLCKIFVKHIINPYCPAFVYAAKNRDAMLANMDERAYNEKIGNVCDRASRSLLVKNGDNGVTLDRAKLDELIDHLKSCGISNVERYRFNALLSQAERNGEWNSYMDLIDTYLASDAMDVTDMTLWMKASPVAKSCNDAKARSRMLEIIKTRIDDIRTGRRAQQTLPQGRQPSQSSLERLESIAKILEGTDA